MGGEGVESQILTEIQILRLHPDLLKPESPGREAGGPCF